MPADVLLDPPVVAARASSVHAMASSPWAPLLAVTGQKQVLLFDTNSLELTGVLPFPEGDPVSLAFTPNARYLIVGGGVPGKSGVTVTFDVVTGERMIGLLYRTAYYAETEEEKEAEAGRAELLLSKNRNGETGHVPLTFIAELMRFETRARDERDGAGE